jgi:hypothetical protein
MFPTIFPVPQMRIEHSLDVRVTLLLCLSLARICSCPFLPPSSQSQSRWGPSKGPILHPEGFGAQPSATSRLPSWCLHGHRLLQAGSPDSQAAKYTRFILSSAGPGVPPLLFRWHPSSGLFPQHQSKYDKHSKHFIAPHLECLILPELAALVVFVI